MKGLLEKRDSACPVGQLGNFVLRPAVPREKAGLLQTLRRKRKERRLLTFNAPPGILSGANLLRRYWDGPYGSQLGDLPEIGFLPLILKRRVFHNPVIQLIGVFLPA